MSLFDDIPGYRDAVEREVNDRDMAFALDAQEMICGVAVNRLTLSHLLTLKAIGSPFVCGGVPSVMDTCTFLWTVSMEHDAALRAQRALAPWCPRLGRWLLNRACARFMRRTLKLKFLDLVTAINAYVDDALCDSPGGSGKRGDVFSPTYYSGAAYVVTHLATQLGWSEREIMQIPVRRLHQYLRCIIKTKNPSEIFFNQSDKVRGAWLKSQNEKAQDGSA